MASFEQRVAEMIRHYQGRTGLTPDTRQGSILRTLFEAVGFYGEQQAHQFDRELRAAIPEAVFAAFGYARQPAMAATVTLRFSRATAAPEPLVIPVGARAQTSGGVVFATTREAVIPLGHAMVEVLAQAVAPGANGNALANTITRLATLMAGVEAVTNPQPAFGGMDEEDAASQERRFAAYLASLARGTIPAIGASALAVRLPDGERATQVLVSDTNHDAAIPVGVVWVHLYRPGGASLALREAVLRALANDQLAAGTMLEVRPVTHIPVNVSATIRTFDADVTPLVVTAAHRFFSAIGIGEDVSTERLIWALTQSDPRVYQVRITSPAGGVAIARYSRAELGAFTTTVETGGPL